MASQVIFSQSSECGLKRTYTKTGAKKVVRRAASFKAGEMMHPYRCHYCRHWHIGHAPENATGNKSGNFERG